MSKTFAELQAVDKVTAEELVETFLDYHAEGAAIYADVVIAIIGRTALKPAQLACLMGCAIGAAYDQEEMGHKKDADEYRRIYQHLKRLSQIA